MSDTAESTSTSPLPLLHQALSRASSPALRRLGTGIVVGWTVGRAAYTAGSRARRRLEYTVRVNSEDAVYRRVHGWVLSLIPPAAGRGLRVETSRTYDSTPEGGGIEPFRLLYDGTRTQSIDVDGHRIRLSLEKETIGNAERRSLFSYELVFTASTLAGRDAVVAHLRRLHEDEVKAPPFLRVAEAWGEWRRMTDVPRRSLDSVILPAGEREALEADLASFLSAEAEYVRWGIPWHRGYLFSGPPGTGKTSIATALAFSFGLDAHYMSLSSVRDDDSLLRSLLNVGPRSVLVIEDIDVVHGSRERDDASGGVSLAGLLNALDGMVTPHGLITILTTNRRDVLDAALIRPGRVDYEWASSTLTAEQAERIAAHFGGDLDGFEIEGRHAADLVAHLKDRSTR